MIKLHKGDLVEFITGDAIGLVVEVGRESIMKIDYVRVYWLRSPEGDVGTTIWRPVTHFQKLEDE
tara:strand:+ start:549 stop:743 length:195 start_codon:yes stop_codon:yes gene_type:complete